MSLNKNKPTDGISRNAFVRTLALGLSLWPAMALKGQTSQPVQSPKTPQPAVDLGNLRAFVELARSDIRTEKALIVAQNIDFTHDEAVDFWPVHREYDLELTRLLDRRYDLILDFASHYGTMTNRQASDLAQEVFDLEEKRTDLKRKYFKKFSKVIPPLKAARFFQIENQLNTAMDLQVAASLPLIK